MEEIKSYKSKDGRLFESKMACELHERKLRALKVFDMSKLKPTSRSPYTVLAVAKDGSFDLHDSFYKTLDYATKVKNQFQRVEAYSPKSAKDTFVVVRIQSFKEVMNDGEDA